MIVIVREIEFDTDGELVDLPNELQIEISQDMTEDEMIDFVSDQISNMTGFCHNGFKIDGID